jgi:hypothetical protein
MRGLNVEKMILPDIFFIFKIRNDHFCEIRRQDEALQTSRSSVFYFGKPNDGRDDI